MSKHISWEVKQRINPKLYHFSYFSLFRIKKAVLEFSKNIKITNYKILDLWCWNKPYISIFNWYSEYIWTDIIPGQYVDIVCDSSNLPFNDNYFDYIICNQTLEHTREIDKAISEIKRVLKINWEAIISVPFLFPEHACPWDFFRFTRFGLQEKFKDFEIISITNDTGYFTTLGLFINILFTYWEISRIIFSPLFFLINIFFWAFEFILINIFYDTFNLKNINLIKYAIEWQYKQFTANYIMIVRNSKK